MTPSELLRTWLLLEKDDGTRRILCNNDPFFLPASVSSLKRPKLSSNSSFKLLFDDHEESYRILFRSLEREECEQKMSELSRQEPIKASEVQDIISKVKSEVMIKVNSKLKSLEETHKQEVSEMKKVYEKVCQDFHDQSYENMKIFKDHNKDMLNVTKRIDGLVETVTSLQNEKKKIKELEKDNEDLRSKITEMDAKLEKLLPQSKHLSAQMQRISNSLSSQKLQLEKKMTSPESENRSWKNFMTQKHKNFDDASSSYGQKLHLLDEFVKSQKTHFSEFVETQKKILEGSKKIQEVRVRVLEGQLNEFKKFIETHQMETFEFNQQLSHLKSSIQLQQEKLTELKEVESRLESSVEESERDQCTKMKELEVQLIGLQSLAESNQNDVSEFSQQFKDFNNSIQRQEKQLTNLKETEHKMGSRLVESQKKQEVRMNYLENQINVFKSFVESQEKENFKFHERYKDLKCKVQLQDLQVADFKDVETEMVESRKKHKEESAACRNSIINVINAVEGLNKRVDSLENDKNGSVVFMNDPEESFEDFVEVPSTSSRNIVYSPIPHQPVTLINDRMFKKFDDCFGKTNVVVLNIQSNGFVKLLISTGKQNELLQKTLKDCLSRDGVDICKCMTVGDCLKVECSKRGLVCTKVNLFETTNDGVPTFFAMFGPKNRIVKKGGHYYFKDRNREQLIDIVNGRSHDLEKLFNCI